MNAKILKQALKEAERELEVARKPTEVQLAASRYMRAKEALKRLEQQTASA